MLPNILLPFYFNAILSNAVLGYMIDQSCTDKGIEETVRNAIRSAFHMVDAAIAHLSTVPLAPDTIELLGFLFAKQNTNPAQLLHEGGLEKTLQVLQGITIFMRNEVTGDTIGNPKDVVRGKQIIEHYR
jgi:hypothetical protein